LIFTKSFGPTKHSKSERESENFRPTTGAVNGVDVNRLVRESSPRATPLFLACVTLWSCHAQAPISPDRSQGAHSSAVDTDTTAPTSTPDIGNPAEPDSAEGRRPVSDRAVEAMKVPAPPVAAALIEPEPLAINSSENTWAQCHGQSECIVAHTECCPPCGGVPRSRLRALNRAKERAYFRSTCEFVRRDPNGMGPVCPACASPLPESITAHCIESLCQLVETSH
jgi:hypothetical protein